MEGPKTGCIIMAAGASERFGADKLAARLGGRSLLRRAFEAVPAARFCRVCVVTARAEGFALAREFGFEAVLNDRPELGASLTVRLGLAALPDCGAALFMTADQPLLRRESVERLLDAAALHPGRIAALAHGGERGNPVLFPRAFFPELAALTGDRGGSAVIKRHPESLLLVETDPRELMDVDYVSDLERLKE